MKEPVVDSVKVFADFVRNFVDFALESVVNFVVKTVEESWVVSVVAVGYHGVTIVVALEENLVVGCW